MIKLEGVYKWHVMANGTLRYVYKDLWLELPGRTSIGVIGRNGTGKSTLVALLSGMEQPDRGRIISDGEFSPPIGLTGGFAPALTGRANVRFVCRILGDPLDVVEQRIEFIHEFSELEEYFDNPVRTYSTGMRARLGFALSMAFDHDYYLIDELTSVGDSRFRDRMRGVLEGKRDKSGILLVSHNMDILRDWCTAGLHIRKGGVVDYYDDINRAIEAHLRDSE